MLDEKGSMNDENDLIDRGASSDTSSMDGRATLTSDRATVGGPHPTSYDREAVPLFPLPSPRPSLSSMRPPQSPPPAFFTRRRQATDGGVRLAGRGLALRRLHSTRSDAASSEDSLSTLPPPYEPHD